MRVERSGPVVLAGQNGPNDTGKIDIISYERLSHQTPINTASNISTSALNSTRG